jgi:hypothetical protein
MVKPKTKQKKSSFFKLIIFLFFCIYKAIEKLSEIDCLPTIKVANGITLAAKKAVADNDDQPAALTLLEQYGAAQGNITQSCVFGMDTARDVLMYVLIDDGQASRQRRQLLCSPSFVHIGVCLQPHKEYGTIALFVLAEKWNDN